MKKTIFIFLLLSSTLHSQTSQNLIGIWKDNNSMFRLYNNYKLETIWDNGSFAEGQWSINGKKLVFSYSNDYQVYEILSYSKNKFSFRQLSNGIVYVANRLEDNDNTPTNSSQSTSFCRFCAGEGKNQCTSCYGKGKIEFYRKDANGYDYLTSDPCTVCHKTGKTKCYHCNGTGKN